MRIGRFAACLVVLAFVAPPAHAAFPGEPGNIAFHSNRDGNFEIYTMTAFGASETRRTNNPANDVSPAWSPDGTKIAFTSNRDGNNEIYVMNADGSGQTRLTFHANDDVTPAWSPDGTKILFGTNRDGNPEIYTMNPDGSAPTRITNHAATDGQAAWSPNGDKIAFITNRDGNFEIYTMNPDGSGPVNISNRSANDFEPDWAPDASRLVWHGTTTTTSTQDHIYTLPPGLSCCLVAGFNGSHETFAAYSPGKSETAIATTRDDPAPTTCVTCNWEIYLAPSPGFSAILTRLTNNAAVDEAPDWAPVVRNYARPKGATPRRIALVPAYTQCTSPNSSHKGVLSTPSCNPPVEEAGFLTLGTPDFNGQPANGVGKVLMKVFCNGGAAGETPPCLTTPGDQLDGSLEIEQTDVRCLGPTGGCAGGANADYTGSVRFEISARITDKNSQASGSATLQDVPIALNIPCAATAATNIGSTCSATTSFDAVLGGASVITEAKRAIWELRNLRIIDGGSDGDPNTGVNFLFLTDGLFFP